ncbi:MAG: phosphatidylserine decarboxylase family protein [Saprospiraceae bacterium]|nr:phosphatidylserine decarboxylase family protein [Saprospiraceae bacterium]
MRYHKEGHRTLIFTAVVFLLGLSAIQNGLPALTPWALILFAAIFGLLLHFFRHPERPVFRPDDQVVLAPADGKVVVIEETIEQEILRERRIQVSIFMSPLNVHVNRYPVGGKITHAIYHPGKYLLAWNPKSSAENERTTVVIENRFGKLLVRQIAGFLARRIVCYPEQGETVKQGDELGFIKFGSRVDLFLPLDARIEVQLNQVVKGNLTTIARLTEPNKPD